MVSLGSRSEKLLLPPFQKWISGTCMWYSNTEGKQFKSGQEPVERNEDLDHGYLLPGDFVVHLTLELHPFLTEQSCG